MIAMDSIINDAAGIMLFFYLDCIVCFGCAYHKSA
jgi:hypothetical protein